MLPFFFTTSRTDIQISEAEPFHVKHSEGGYFLSWCNLCSQSTKIGVNLKWMSFDVLSEQCTPLPSTEIMVKERQERARPFAGPWMGGMGQNGQAAPVRVIPYPHPWSNKRMCTLLFFLHHTFGTAWQPMMLTKWRKLDSSQALSKSKK